MRERNCAVRKAIPKPVATDLDDAGYVPGGVVHAWVGHKVTFLTPP